MIYEVLIDSAAPSFFQETTLDGRTYRLLFRWNAREGYWYLSLLDIQDVPIVSGMKLVSGAFLLRHCVDYERRPPGELLMTETPTRDNLGGAASLVYADEDSL